jgi:predicted GIY-YIG superfamily endonuclease
MFYVYLLQSEDYSDQSYVGLTADLKQRFAAHNAGKSPHTSKFRPWRLVTMSRSPIRQRRRLSSAI